MIRINLLGTAKPKKGKKSRRLFTMPQLTTDGPSPLISGLAILVVASAGLYLYYLQLERTHEKLQSSIVEANGSHCLDDESEAGVFGTAERLRRIQAAL